MRLYVINLERSSDRLARMGRQFARYCLDFTRIRAIDARHLDEGQYVDVQNRNIWPQALTRGEVACFLSHAQALQRLVADNVAYGVIFEDDVKLGAHAEQWLSQDDWLQKWMKQAAQPVDIVKLETSEKKVWLGPNAMLEGKQITEFALAQIKSTHIMAAAYMISRDAAMRLLDLMQQNSAPFDHFLFNFSLGNAQKFSLYQLNPAIVIQENLASTLEKERAADKEQIKQRRTMVGIVARELRRLIRRARTGIWGIKTNFFTADQWKRVPFAKET